MKSISIKIKLATLFAISVLIGIVVYAKADRTFLDSNDADRYSIESDASTNLDANIIAHPRASEYITSSEYSTKMAPTTTQATEYLAMHVNNDNAGGGYAVKRAPISGQRSVPSSGATYQDFGMKSAVTSNNSVRTTEPQENQRTRDVKTDYPKAVNNAATSDQAYLVKATAQHSSGNNYGGYGVRSAGGQDVSNAQVPNRQSNDSYGGYAVRSADASRSKTPSTGTHGGYAVRSAGGGGKNATTEMTAEGYGRKSTPYSTHNGFFDEIQAGGRAQLAQYDNAKQGDVAYQVRSVPQSGGEYGGYAVRSAGSKDVSSKQHIASNSSNESYGGYAVRKIPTSSGTVQYAQSSTPARSAESEYGGYAVRSAGGKDIGSRTVASTTGESYGGYAVRTAGSAKTGTSIAQYENASSNDNAYQVKSSAQNQDESYGGYAVRSAGGKDINSRTIASTSTSVGESYGGYAVRSPKGQQGSRQSTSIAQVSRSNRLTIYDGTKVYDRRGHRLALNAPQKDRSVIVMPKRGKSIAGVVIQDDPGRSIVVQANSGTQLRFNYGEIDALVNL